VNACVVLCADEAFIAKSCSELPCLYGARCVTKSDGTPECLCNATVCEADGSEEALTCGTDGMMYGSECQLRLVACRLQKDIRVAGRGSCWKGLHYIYIHIYIYIYIYTRFVDQVPTVMKSHAKGLKSYIK